MWKKFKYQSTKVVSKNWNPKIYLKSHTGIKQIWTGKKLISQQIQFLYPKKNKSFKPIKFEHRKLTHQSNPVSQKTSNLDETMKPVNPSKQNHWTKRIKSNKSINRCSLSITNPWALCVYERKQIRQQQNLLVGEGI